MIVSGYEIPTFMFKVVSKYEYYESFKNGKILFRPLGYFQQQDDCYRGDISEGNIPLSLGDMPLTITNPDSGESVFLNKDFCKITNFRVSYGSDDFIPVFCASMLDECNTIINNDKSSFIISKLFLDEMSQFGDYIIIFDFKEFIHNVIKKCNKENYGYIYRKMKYADKESYFSIEKILKDCDVDREKIFFLKDNKYSAQNEWRIIIMSNKDEKIFNSINDMYFLEIDKLNTTHCMPIKDLYNVKFSISKQ